MLNTTIYKNESKVVAVTKEIEKTISPDKVTEMYDKVKEEVEKTFVRDFPIKTDTLNGVIVEFAHDFETMQRKTYTRFVLNGKEYIVKQLHETFEALSDRELFDTFAKHYQEAVATEIMKVVGIALLKKKRITHND